MGYEHAHRTRRAARPTDAQALHLQAKLEVGSSTDPLEHEADLVAADVVRRLRTPASDPVGTETPMSDTRIRRMAGSASAGDGFQATPEVESAIASSRGRGAALPDDVRPEFERAMGTDLSGVRIHTGDTADRLNRQVAAKAFTTGSDIYFSNGTYDPRSESGQRLLAHELTHTVQQSGGVQRTKIQRLSFEKTNWSKTKRVSVLQAGGSGTVAEFTDGSKPLIVKADQVVGPEVMLAGNILQDPKKKKGLFGGGGSKPSVEVPRSRVATPDEVEALRKATATSLDPTTPPRNFVTGLSSPRPVLVFDKSSGERVGELAADTHVDSAADKNNVVNKLVNQPKMWRALGEKVPADVYMGMFDRLIGTFNADNFLYDAKKNSFAFVDNTQAHYMGKFTADDSQGLDSEFMFREWAGQSVYVQMLAQDNLAGLASGVYSAFEGWMTATFDPMITKTTADDRKTFLRERKATGKVLQPMLDANKAAIEAAMIVGITAGKAKLLANLSNPLKMVAGVDPAKKHEVLQSLLARRYFLEGMSPDAAWNKAATEAARLLPQKQAPARPKSSAPVKKPGAATAKPGTNPKNDAMTIGNFGPGNMPKLPALPGSG